MSRFFSFFVVACIGVAVTSSAWASSGIYDTAQGVAESQIRVEGHVAVDAVLVSGVAQVSIPGPLTIGQTLSTGGSAAFAGTVTAQAYYHSSDVRLKTDIRPAQGLAIIDKLNGVTFKWKKDGSPGAGIIAQDVAKVMPGAVKIGANGYEAVEYDQLMAPMIQSIRELQTQNENLKAELAKLEARMDAIQTAHVQHVSAAVPADASVKTAQP
ncbi:MAG: tail fiber domain-containing protein [Alphaproteobacteria bacterium]|nr:tail fiber domain-containing protein [Alphaproteobacteria bacterium]